MLLEMAGFLLIQFSLYCFGWSIVYGIFYICYSIWDKFVVEPKRAKEMRAMIEEWENRKFRF